MSKLNEYVEQMKQYQKQHPKKSETQIVRHIYLDLGLKLSFDAKFYFGNAKERKQIYDANGKKSIEKSMEEGNAICTSMSYLMEYILQQLNIDATTIIDYVEKRSCAHMYNMIRPKGEEPYYIDLQEDIKYIQSHSRTKHFGISIKDGKTPIMSLKELEAMDKEDGYITDEHYYADDYLYLLKYDSSIINDLRQKAEFIFENLEPDENTSFQWPDRTRRLSQLIKKLFTQSERSHIRLIDCYYDDKNKETYETCIAVETGNIKETEVYRFLQEEQQFRKRTIDEFAKEVANGLKCKQGILGLKQALKQLEESER